jgi:CDP-glucose 4,6-dehydratase
MANVLITGANGFVGRKLVEHHRYSDNVIAMTHDTKGGIYRVGHVVGVEGDIRDYDFVRRVIAHYEIDTVYHMAAQSIVRKCAQDPMTAYEINVMGTVRLLEACRHVGNVKSIVVSTSDKAYGHAESPYNENTPFRPQFTYEATKSCQDFVCQNFFYNYDLPVKILRCSNIYGPGDSNSSRLIPNVIRKVDRGERPVVYAGVADYLREFIYIDDAVDAFTLVNEKAAPGEAYCVGGTTGGVTIRELVQTIMRLMDEEDLGIEYPEKAILFKEIKEQYIDSSKLRELGWKPQYTLEEGLLDTIRFYAGSQ